MKKWLAHAMVVAVTLLGTIPLSTFQSRAANGSVAYSYDALGRITTASYDTGVCIAYTYDPAGNRLSESILIAGSGGGAIWGCFNWGAANWTVTTP